MTTRVTLGSSAPLVPTTEFSISGTVTAGDAVYQVSGADNTVARADASDAGKRPPIGIVQSVSGGSCVVALNSEVATSLSGLTRGTVYWLGTVPGQLVDTKTASNSYPLGIAVSATELRVDTVAYGINIAGGNGTVTSAGITSSDLTVSNSPITTSGVIDLALNTVPVSKGGTGLTSAVEQGASLIASSSSAYVAQATSLSWRNRIINGDMRVAQRGTAAVNGSYPVDRWYCEENTGATATFVQGTSATAPAGWSNSITANCTVSGTATGSQYAILLQRIEGSSIADFAWGTASARTITLSFWVRSAATGTYCVAVRNSGPTRMSYVAEYSISLADAWEYKTVTIPGPTSGDWATGSSTGIALTFDLGSGSNWNATASTWTSGLGSSGDGYIRTSSQTNWLGAAPRTFYLTGVQLELGSVATPFEMLQYEKQLELCQRYFARLSSLSGNYVGFGSGYSFTTNNAFVYVKYPQVMRAAPTLSQSNTGILNTAIRGFQSFGTAYPGDSSLGVTVVTLATTQVIGQGVLWTGNNNASAYVDLNAEL